MSDTIHTALRAISNNFVGKYLGYNHLTRDEVLKDHSSKSFNKLLSLPDDNIFLILDGTYLYVEKPTDFTTQWLLWSGQKKRHLAKVMMVVTTTGRILNVAGLYGSNGYNNDASILINMLSGTYHNFDFKLYAIKIFN